MTELIDSIWLLLGAALALVFLGLLAGFSPTLYAAQMSMATDSKKSSSYAISIMVGVILAIIALGIFFQFFQFDTLNAIIDSRKDAMVVSSVFNLVIGFTFILAGIWYIRKKTTPKKESRLTSTTAGHLAFAGLGFFRTFLSLSGATSTFMAIGLIANTDIEPVGRLLLSFIFLAAAIAPFVVILIEIKKRPHNIQKLLNFVKHRASTPYFHSVVGLLSIILGASIALFALVTIYK